VINEVNDAFQDPALATFVSFNSRFVSLEMDADFLTTACIGDPSCQIVIISSIPTPFTQVCVCILEFLSIYETERLVQELSKFGIDSHSIVVNQVLFPEKDAEELGEWYDSNKAKLPKEAQEICSKLMACKRMQDKHVGQCFDPHGDGFHVILMPLLDYEVRGVEKIKTFSELLINPVDLEE
jgi:arsenite-transporting ATPase